jgi:hypothetical protein
LFGKSFHVSEWRNSPGNAGYAFVEYRHLTRLYIPTDVTDLAFVPDVSVTKLTCNSIQALINLGMEIPNLCHNHPAKFGNDYQENDKKKS